MYDEFSSDYDRFVNWSERLQAEMPFLLGQFQELGGQRRVLDAACGTGMHAISLVESGYNLVGTDLSAGMVAKARLNAGNAGIKVTFLVAGFGELAPALRREGLLVSPFDAVICLGNSLPHLLSPQALATALTDFAACLRPGGLLVIQNRNFDAVMAQGQRWMEPQSYREGEREWIFLRFYDFEPLGLLAFNILTLRRDGGGVWQQHIATTRLRPILQGELLQALATAGFSNITSYGSLAGADFNPQSSGNLVVTGRR